MVKKKKVYNERFQLPFVIVFSFKLVRFIRDMKMNESNSCRNITLSDYIPDATGSLSELKQLVCTMDKVELFGELPPLLFAAQVRSAFRI